MAGDTTDDFQPNQPTSSGRMYITPTPVPVLTPDQQQAAQAQVAAMTRSPVAPPAVSGVSGVTAPDLGSGLLAAFQHLPVQQAIAAYDAASQYQAMRGYQQDLANGMPAYQAAAKWLPILHSKNPAGMATALRMMRPQTPAPMSQAQALNYQLQRQRLAQAARPKVPTVKVPLDPSNPFGASITGPVDSPEVQQAMKKAEAAQAAAGEKANTAQPGLLESARNFLFGTPTPAAPPAGVTAPPPAAAIARPPVAATPTPAAPPQPRRSPFREGQTVRNKKTGKLYRIVNGEPVLIEDQAGASK